MFLAASRERVPLGCGVAPFPCAAKSGWLELLRVFSPEFARDADLQFSRLVGLCQLCGEDDAGRVR